MMFSWVIDLLSRAAAYAVAFFGGFKYGTERQKRKEAEEDLKGIRDVKKIHENIDNDSSYRERIRLLFNKK